MKISFVFFFLSGILGCCKAQKAPKNVYTIAFYNVENLFDTEDDPNTDDAEYLPTAPNQWDNAKYQTKLDNLSTVISGLGSLQAPDILGLCEIENKRVIEDLIAMPKLKDKNYGIVHYNSPDLRGIDVGLIYKKNVFRPFAEKSCSINFLTNPDKTRDFLIVSGILSSKDTLHVIVAHFPSRRSGAESEQRRIFVASEIRSKIDSLQKKSRKANILMMGDLNDEPTNISISQTLNAKSEASKLTKNQLFNAMGKLQAEGKGSHFYYNTKEKKGEWNVLDQIILSPAMLGKKASLRYVEGSATIHKPDFLLQQEPPSYKGQPLRTFGGKKYLAGYSDHLPIFVQIGR